MRLGPPAPSGRKALPPAAVAAWRRTLLPSLPCPPDARARAAQQEEDERPPPAAAAATPPRGAKAGAPKAPRAPRPAAPTPTPEPESPEEPEPEPAASAEPDWEPPEGAEEEDDELEARRRPGRRARAPALPCLRAWRRRWGSLGRRHAP